MNIIINIILKMFIINMIALINIGLMGKYYTNMGWSRMQLNTYIVYFILYIVSSVFQYFP